ncbi:MAG: GNAT family N-acetyltransferase [Anaerolineales bacterium]
MRSRSERPPLEAELRSISLAERSDYLGWLARAPFVHEQVGWIPTSDWIGRSPSLALLSREGLPLGLLCVSCDQLGVAWIQAFGSAPRPSPSAIWEPLWAAACSQLKSMAVDRVWAMADQPWFLSLLQGSGFAPASKVATLVADRPARPQPPPQLPGLTLRPLRPQDLPPVSQLDNRAFEIPWQMDAEALAVTLQNAPLARVAQAGPRIIGYDLCTETFQGWHLARLAVDPDYQHRGVGQALVIELLESKQREEVRTLTVNTQAENSVSLRLYRSLGFAPSGETIPVYCAALS